MFNDDGSGIVTQATFRRIATPRRTGPSLARVRVDRKKRALVENPRAPRPRERNAARGIGRWGSVERGETRASDRPVGPEELGHAFPLVPDDLRNVRVSLRFHGRREVGKVRIDRRVLRDLRHGIDAEPLLDDLGELGLGVVVFRRRRACDCRFAAL